MSSLTGNEDTADPVKTSVGLRDASSTTINSRGDTGALDAVIKGILLKQQNIINTFDLGVRHFPIELAVMNYSPEFAKAVSTLPVRTGATG
ncbi:hypothetical protein PWP93_25865 [Paraburkholderia sp. A1RI-2L]|uniref:hypothetical protein n=1 Tax=Paraburkholderia sp. A1RI-2L TaxID=3028367 RepID=UPI003B76BD53